jgi:hypothetical protein
MLQQVTLQKLIVGLQPATSACARARTHARAHTHKKQVWTTRITSHNRTTIYRGDISALLYVLSESLPEDSPEELKHLGVN